MKKSRSKSAISGSLPASRGHFPIVAIGASAGGLEAMMELLKYLPPNTGMAFQAKADFPGIDFSKSVMVGDSISDMEFGKRLHMTTVLIEGKPQGEIPLALVDYRFASLFDFADSI